MLRKTTPQTFAQKGHPIGSVLPGRTKTMLVATATPVQLHPIELWDLLSILSVNNPQVLGGPNSQWRKADGPEIFDIVAGRTVVERLYDKWQYWRNPLPAPFDTKHEVFDWVRTDLDLTLHDDQATAADLDRIDDDEAWEQRGRTPMSLEHTVNAWGPNLPAEFVVPADLAELEAGWATLGS